MHVSRRRMLGWCAAAVPALLAPGCTWTRRVRVRCPDYALDRAGPLAIDPHAHFFNASDLAVKGFVQRVKLRSGSGPAASIAGILQNLTWDVAPDGDEEQKLLRRLSGELAGCRGDALPGPLGQAREERYAIAAREIRAASERSLRAGSPSADARLAAREAEVLPPTYRELLDELEYTANEEPPPGEVASRQITVKSALHFVVEMLQYRTTSFFDYLEAYGRGAGPRLDLSLAALVDYDWWLQDGGLGTRTPLRQQVELARDLSILTGGRVHALAPFCPLREVIHRASPGRTFSSLELVRWAVEEQGAVGVKLYPPMGFAPAGNAGLDIWRQAAWLPPEAHRDDFGARLDEVLGDLLGWCRAEGVPVLAHSSRSNGPLDVFEALAGSRGWKIALERHPDLRVLLGHFGGAGDAVSRADAEALRDLMHPSGPGGALFADASYFERALEKPRELVTTLAALFGPPLLPDRLCFGSDWKMLTLERRSGQYLSRLDGVAGDLAAAVGLPRDGFRRSFFGANAARWLGLRAGEPARRRLDAFYERHGVPRPSWAAKVDAAAA